MAMSEYRTAPRLLCNGTTSFSGIPSWKDHPWTFRLRGRISEPEANVKRFGDERHRLNGRPVCVERSRKRGDHWQAGRPIESKRPPGRGPGGVRGGGSEEAT